MGVNVAYNMTYFWGVFPQEMHQEVQQSSGTSRSMSKVGHLHGRVPGSYYTDRSSTACGALNNNHSRIMKKGCVGGFAGLVQWQEIFYLCHCWALCNIVLTQWDLDKMTANFADDIFNT